MRFTYLRERIRHIDGVEVVVVALTSYPSVAASPSTIGIANAAPALAPANNEAGMR